MHSSLLQSSANSRSPTNGHALDYQLIAPWLIRAISIRKDWCILRHDTASIVTSPYCLDIDSIVYERHSPGRASNRGVEVDLLPIWAIQVAAPCIVAVAAYRIGLRRGGAAQRETHTIRTRLRDAVSSVTQFSGTPEPTFLRAPQSSAAPRPEAWTDTPPVRER